MEIIAEKRQNKGKQNKRLRKERKIPAAVYGQGMDTDSLTIDLNNFIKVYKEAGETTLIDLKYNGTNEKVLVKEVQVNPISLEPIHVSFHKVNLKEKISANVPVEVIGEEDSPIVKSGEGLVLVLHSEIEVEALPTDLPSEFTVDVSKLTEVGAGITVGELAYDREKVEIVDLEEDEIIVKIDYAEMLEEEETEVSEEELIAGVEATEEKPESEEEGEGEEESKEKTEE